MSDDVDHAQLASRVLHLERTVAEMAVLSSEQRARLREDVKANTDMTMKVKETADGVKRDTEEIVSLLKGLKVFGRVAKWILGIFAAVAAFFGVGHSAKWW